ncbi:MAG: GH3 auxin-responsive promoter family protein [Planctomyces sp.]|nr:GH3 auxin-responsive promoter family protein [Planctomyces sp.]
MLKHLRYALGYGPRWQARRTRAAFLNALNHCESVQRRLLLGLLQLHADSEFSRDHGLDYVRSIPEFQRALPIADFERVRPYVERLQRGDWQALFGPRQRPLMFAMSSGTTALPKAIPISRRYLADYRRSWQTWGIDLYTQYPRMNFLHIVQLASDFDRARTEAGTPCGNITGFVQHIQNPIIRTMYSVPSGVLKLTDPIAKYYASLRFALADADVGMLITANPGTLIHLGELAAEHQESLLRDIAEGTLSLPGAGSEAARQGLSRRLTPRPERARVLARLASRRGRLELQDAWSNLQLLGVWTAGSAAAYLPRLRGMFPGVPIRDHGLSASEGRMTITLEDETRSAPLDITSHFFEFIPEWEIDRPRPPVLLAHELQPGAAYYILLTTSCGLYRYNIQDVVRCTGYKGTTPLLEFLHKGAHISNVTGEKLTESQVVEAVGGALRSLAQSLSYYSLTPVWGNPPQYHLLIDERELPPALDRRLAAEVDSALMRLNCEYEDKRRTSRLKPVVVSRLPVGTWQRLIQSRQARPSGSLEQYKHPCLAPGLDFRDRLLEEHGGRQAIPA